MKENLDLISIVTKSEKIGYFDFNDFPHLSLSLSQYDDLMDLLNKKNIPFGKQNNLNKREAVLIINSLRKGIPSQEGITTFNVGREKLIGYFKKDIEDVKFNKSKVKFLNADYGLGKTHSLYLLKELAFENGFIVSHITLSKSSCPLHDFMEVYKQIIWNLRTNDERNKPAIENVLNRWLEFIKKKGEENAKKIIHNLDDNLKSALHSYYESVSLLRPSELKRMLVLDYISGKNIYLKNLKKIHINNRIDSSNALIMLGYMSSLFRNLGYSGICIFFDEADEIHSFSKYNQIDKAYNNLLHFIQNSKDAKNCYFLYSTTPSFFDNYSSYWSKNIINTNDILELEQFNSEQLEILAIRLYNIYLVYKDKNKSKKIIKLLKQRSNDNSSFIKISDFVRQVISLLDELV